MDDKASKFELDIEIKDLLWEFLRKWRLIAVLALICGIALTAYQYRLDRSKTDVVTVKKTQEELESSLGKQDLGEVAGAVALFRQLEEKSTYMDESVLMQVNPYEENAVLLQYYVSAGTEGLASDAAEAYMAYVENDSLAQDVTEKGAYGLAPMYLAELISIANDDGNVYVNASNTNQSIHLSVQESHPKHTFSVKIVGQTREEAEAIAAEVKNAMESYHRMAAGTMGAHQLQLLGESSSVLVDQSLAELQNRNAAAIKTLTNNLDSMKNEMTSDQITLYVYRTTVTAEEPAEEAEAVTAVPVVQISFKHTAIGAVVGAVLACGIIFALYLFSAALRSSEEVKTLYKVKVLGNIDDSAFRKKKLFGFVDGFIIRLQHLRKKKLSYEQEIQMITANIALDCKKNKRTEIFMDSSAAEAVPTEIMNAVIEKCEEKGIHVHRGNAIVYDADALEAAAKIGSIVFVEKKRVSLYDELYKEVALCREHEIDVIGMVVLGE